MSTDDNSTNEYRGPKVRTNATATPGLTGQYPADFAGRGLPSFTNSQQQRLWDALNYPQEATIDRWDYHWSRYRRQEIAGGLVDKFVDDTWQDAPDIHDDAGTDGDEERDETPFETAVAAFFDNTAPLSLRQDPLGWMAAVDVLATLGEFAVLVLGFKDDQKASEPADANALTADGDSTDAGDGTDADIPGNLGALAFIDAFHEDQTDPNIGRDMSDPDSYGTVTSYDIAPRNGPQQTVDTSRVIHPTEGTLTTPLKGERFLTRGINRFVDADKILGASGEGYWRGGYSGYLLKPPEVITSDGNRRRGEFGDDGSALAKQMRQFEDRFKRNIRTNGEVEPLESDVADPESHMAEVYKALAAGYDVPHSVFMGNETGERATTEDSAMWRSTIAGRRRSYAEGQIVRPIIDRLIDVGILPEPDGESYTVEWPSLSELTDKEEADIRNTDAQALNSATAGQPTTALTLPEIRENILGLDPERGSESETPADEQDQRAADAQQALAAAGLLNGQSNDDGSAGTPIEDAGEPSGMAGTTDAITTVNARADGGEDVAEDGGAMADETDASDE